MINLLDLDKKIRDLTWSIYIDRAQKETVRIKYRELMDLVNILNRDARELASCDENLRFTISRIKQIGERLSKELSKDFDYGNIESICLPFFNYLKHLSKKVGES